jgi:hypothetical protein
MQITDVISGDPKGATCVTSPATLAERQSTSRQWTLKGLAPETVNVSREAARRSGMKLNAWVSRALEQAAMGTDGNSPVDSHEDPFTYPPNSGDTLQYIKEELVRLRAQNEDMRSTVNTMSSILLKLCADRI